MRGGDKEGVPVLSQSNSITVEFYFLVELGQSIFFCH